MDPVIQKWRSADVLTENPLALLVYKTFSTHWHLAGAMNRDSLMSPASLDRGMREPVSRQTSFQRTWSSICQRPYMLARTSHRGVKRTKSPDIMFLCR